MNLKIKKNIKNKKGSLVLSLMASATVATTIMVTHQVAQNFSSGKAQGLSQQQAFLLAQESVALASLMVQKNVVVCSNVRMTDSNGNLKNQVRGCYRGNPLPREDILGELKSDGEVNKVAHAFYEELKLDTNPPGDRDSWFENIDLNFNKMEGKKALVFNKLKQDGVNLKNNYHPRFKNAEITWAVRSTNDPAIREALSLSDIGVTCRNTRTLIEREGTCPSHPLDMRHSLYSHSVAEADIQCKDSDGNNIADSKCDYYAVKDSDSSIVFISVAVPYQSAVKKNQKIVMNAAVRRPVAVYHIQPESGSSCSMNCEPAISENYDGNFPRCVGLSDYRPNDNRIAETDALPVGTQLLRTKLKVINKGPGILFDMSLKREDVDMDTNLQLGGRIVKAREFKITDDPRPVGPRGSRPIYDLIPCYYSSYYEINVKSISCTCQEGGPGSGTQIGPDGSICRGTLSCDNVVKPPTSIVRVAPATPPPIPPLPCSNNANTNTPPLANSSLTRAQGLCSGPASTRPSFCTNNRCVNLPGSSVPTPLPANLNIGGNTGSVDCIPDNQPDSPILGCEAQSLGTL